MKTSELTGAQLDYWVARAEGYEYVDVPPDVGGKNAGRALLPKGILASGWAFPPKGPVGDFVPRFSEKWDLVGPIIDREGIFFEPSNSEADGSIFAYVDDGHEISPGQFGPSRLVAAMRCYVASKFGEKVEASDA